MKIFTYLLIVQKGAEYYDGIMLTEQQPWNRQHLLLTKGKVDAVVMPIPTINPDWHVPAAETIEKPGGFRRVENKYATDENFIPCQSLVHMHTESGDNRLRYGILRLVFQLPDNGKTACLFVDNWDSRYYGDSAEQIIQGLSEVETYPGMKRQSDLYLILCVHHEAIECIAKLKELLGDKLKEWK